MNNTSKNKSHNHETYVVSTDIILEIAQIILQADLPHEIIGVKENKRQIIIGISYQNNLKFHQEAVKNIADILKDYHELCNEESETVNWRES
ncbi:MAG: hypothetical protein WAQ28_18825 [Bacteroidia bacterium]|jgi:hypothetical protein